MVGRRFLTARDECITQMGSKTHSLCNADCMKTASNLLQNPLDIAARQSSRILLGEMATARNSRPGDKPQDKLREAKKAQHGGQHH